MTFPDPFVGLTKPDPDEKKTVTPPLLSTFNGQVMLTTRVDELPDAVADVPLTVTPEMDVFGTVVPEGNVKVIVELVVRNPPEPVLNPIV